MGWEGREGRERSLREGRGASAVGPCRRCPGRHAALYDHKCVVSLVCAWARARMMSSDDRRSQASSQMYAGTWNQN